MSAPPNKPAEPRIAVVFIHGQGEQRPMEDVQELARTVWCGDPRRARKNGDAPQVFLTPDETLGLADLGRVTTEAREHGVRVDFYELYWAHLMSGNKLSHLADWFRRLQSRPRKDAPPALLPVRQTVIRFMESLTILAILFVAMTALLTPPGGQGLARETVEQMWSGVSFGLAPAALLKMLPGPEDFVAWLGLSVVIALVWALLELFRNEVRNGAPVRRRIAHPWKIKRRSLQLALRNRIATVFVTGFALLVLTIMVLQGPFANWSDMRVFLLLAALVASVLLALRMIEPALIASVAASGIALAVALFGGLGDARTVMLGDNAAPPAWLFIGVDATLDAPAHYALRAEFADALAIGVMSIALFAALWFVAGLLRGVSAARFFLVRLIATVLLGALGVAMALGALHIGLDTHSKHWAIFALGVTIAVVVGAAALMFALASAAFLVPVMADSARYFSRDPAHIGARQRIRQAGLRLLEKLHERPASQGGYRRVIVVAHSLGSAVGYELLIDFWGRRAGDLRITPDSGLAQCVLALEKAAHQLNIADAANYDAAFAAFRQAQTDLQAELLCYSAAVRSKDDARQLIEPPQRRETVTDQNAYPRHWLITDFITLGSPLTYASLLMADSPAHLVERFKDRTLSTCPPILFDENNAACLYRGDQAQNARADDVKRVITFKGYDDNLRFAHHACFAPVRWTNHYFPSSNWIAEGDVIGGRLAPDIAKLKPEDHGVMGRGVLDKSLNRSHTGALFAHNEYWRSLLETHRLRETLKPSLGGPQAEAPANASNAGKPSAEPAHIAALIQSMALDDTLTPPRLTPLT